MNGTNEEDGAVISDGEEEEPRKSKKARLEEYPQGTIKKVRVFDFMTYAGSVTMTPGPRLNLVLGPNGTGKSSLVCAICIGLGGGTKLLGRADNLSEYIRRGKSSCWTEITLSGGAQGRDQVLRRDIRTEAHDGVKSYKSNWKLNNRDCTQKDVQALVASFNIQFDNLCQFLPQDKVSEFAMMNSKQLLEATEKAIGDSTLYRHHQQLITDKEKYNQDKQSRDNSDNQLQKLLKEHEKQQNDYQRFEAKEALKAKIELLQMKILWLRFNKRQAALKEAKEKLAEAEATLRKRQSELKEDTEPIRDLEAQANALRTKKDQHSRALQNMKASLQQTGRQLDETKAALEDCINSKHMLREQSKQREKKIMDMQASIRQLQAEIQAAPSEAPQSMHDRKQQLNQQVTALFAEMGEHDEQQQERRNRQLQLDRQVNGLEERLQRLGDVRLQRLRKLEQRGRGAGLGEVYQWVCDNRSHFRGQVLGPLGLEVNCNMMQYSGYVEAHIGGKLLDFVCEYSEDEARLSEYLRSRKLSFPVSSTEVEQTMPHPLGEAAQYSQVGVAHTLDEVFEAPNLIKHFLKDTTGINRVYILHNGSNPEQVAAALLSPGPGHGSTITMYMNQERHGFSQSKYNVESKLTSVNDVRPSNILAGCVNNGDEAEKVRLIGERQQLLAERETLAAALAQGQNREQYLLSQQHQLQQQQAALSNEMEKVHRKRADLSKMLKVKEGTLAAERAKPDPLDKEPEFMNKIKSLADKLQRLGISGTNTLKDTWEAVQALAALDLSYKEVEMQVQALSDAAERRRAAVKQMEDMVTSLKHIVETERKLTEQAKTLRDAEAPRSEQLDAVIKSPPMTEEAVQEEIRSKEIEMDDITCSNPNVYREYKARQESIAVLEKQVECADAALTALHQSMVKTREEWLPALTHIVSTINDSFRRNFAEIGCAGEVVLEEGALQREEYDKCALEIRVKFRESEELTVLTSNRQSGGERSVSTLLFLIALQGVTVTPFRVIDEINQGMDPINERRVFTQLVDSSCRPNTPQCFLLTPKLLPALHFSPAITVLQIMNGPHIHTELPAKMDNKAFALFGNRIVTATA